jgi:hypothetical protein
LGELHCNNDTILQLVGRGGSPFAAVRHDLRCLSDWIQQDPIGQQIEALYACTILSGAASRLGFTVRPKPVTVRQRFERFFFKGLLLLYNQEGTKRIQHGSTADGYPADVWISRRELIRRYGKPTPRAEEAVRSTANLPE